MDGVVYAVTNQIAHYHVMIQDYAHPSDGTFNAAQCIMENYLINPRARMRSEGLL